MITSTIKVFNRFPEITAEIEAATIRALEAAAEAGRVVADERARNLKPFVIVPPGPSGNGFRSGIKGSPLVRIFDHGSLGKHVGKLKRERRPQWEVKRGSNPYTAHRGDIEGEGIEPRTILSPARTAGRKVLVDAIRRI